MSALTIDPAHSDEPPAELRERARDTGASLAYTAEAGWHLIPSPALLRLIEKTPRRKTPPQKLKPPAAVAPSHHRCRRCRGWWTWPCGSTR